MPSPPPAGKEFVVSIAVPGPVTTKEDMDKFEQFKKACNELAKKYNGRVTEVRLQP